MSKLWSVPCDSLTSVKTLPALTTVFTPPPICSSYFTESSIWAGGDFGTSTTGRLTAIQNHQDPVWYSCIPEEYDTKQCPSLTFSPGLCPQEWTTLDIRSKAGVTTASCCMRCGTSLNIPNNGALRKADWVSFHSGFILDPSADNCRKSTTDFAVTRRPNPDRSMITATGYIMSWNANTAYVVLSDRIVTTVLTSYNFGQGPQLTGITVTFADPDHVTATQAITMDDGYLYHSPWVIMWQSSDRVDTEATTTPQGPTELPETEDRHTSLSGGAIAGVVIGVLAAFGLGVMMGFLIRRRRQRPVEGREMREQPISVQQDNSGGQGWPERRPNGSVAPDMAYAVEGGTAVGSSHSQPRPWFAFLGSRGRSSAA